MLDLNPPRIDRRRTLPHVPRGYWIRIPMKRSLRSDLVRAVLEMGVVQSKVVLGGNEVGRTVYRV